MEDNGVKGRETKDGNKIKESAKQISTKKTGY